MKIYVISLLNDVGRRNKLKLNFKKEFDEFNIIFAKDRNDALVFKENENNSFNENMTLSEIACTLSHINTLKLACQSEYEFSLILEDDVIGKDEDIVRLTQISKILPMDSILIAGGQEGLKSYNNLFGILINEKYQIYRIPKIYYRYLARTSSYLVSKKIAEYIVYKQEKRLIFADQWDVLLSECDNIYFSPILKHPLSLENSHIEAERKIKKGSNIFIAIYREGFLLSIYFFLRKKISAWWAKIKKYHNISKLSKKY